MIHEMSWYLEGRRFTGLAEELEAGLRRYGEAKRAGDKDTTESLREETRALFERHCVRAGLRTVGVSYVNLDAEFFSGNALDEVAMNSFIKNIIKGHCRQKVLWDFMGTTGLLTAISRSEMAKAGLRYDDYLPLEYKNDHPQKKPLEGGAGKDVEIFYQYGDGTISKEYMPERAKMRFDRLEDKSGVDWKEGYDPNGKVRKDGWHGGYDPSGSWIRKDGQGRGIQAAGHEGAAYLELVQDGDGAMLYDPGMMLLTAPLLLYMTEEGEPYGELSMDRGRTAEEIDKMLKVIGAAGISAIGGMVEGGPDLLEAYRKALGPLALPNLRVARSKEALAIREAHEKKIVEAAAESVGTRLERKLRVAGQYGGGAAALASGGIVVPLSPGKAADGIALGLSGEEIARLGAVTVKAEHAETYDAVLSNIYASWPHYAGHMSRLDFAGVVKDYLERGGVISGTMEAQTTVGEIIHGGEAPQGEAPLREGVSLHSSGIPGMFRETEVVDFYDGAAKEKYLKTLERKRILPKNGAAAALEALKTLPEESGEQKAEMNRRLTRALGEYKAISASTGMPLGELVSAAKGANPAALGKKVYYELQLPALITAAGKENLQKRKIDIEVAAGEYRGAVIIGGTSGPALDDVLLTREVLAGEYGFSEWETNEAQEFLHGIRLVPGAPAFPPSLMEALGETKPGTAAALRKSILNVLDKHEGASYNLASDAGLKAYAESRRSKVTKKEIRVLLHEEIGRGANKAALPGAAVRKIEIQYRDGGSVVPLTRSAPKGIPERIRLAEIADAASGIGLFNVAGLGGFNGETLEREYGYATPEAEAVAEYFRSINIPTGGEGYFTNNLLPLFAEALRGTKNVEALKEGIQTILHGAGDAGLLNVAGLGGFSGETLEREYGYAPPDAEAAAEYLRGLNIPVGGEGHFAKNIFPSFVDALKRTKKAAEFKEDVQAILRAAGTGIRTGDEASPPYIPTRAAPLIFGGGTAVDGAIHLDAARLEAFDEETLEKEYGYSALNAKAAAEYLKSIKIPASGEGYFMRDFSPLPDGIVRNAGNAAELKERIADAFEQGMIPSGAGAGYASTAVSHGGSTATGGRHGEAGTAGRHSLGMETVGGHNGGGSETAGSQSEDGHTVIPSYGWDSVAFGAGPSAAMPSEAVPFEMVRTGQGSGFANADIFPKPLLAHASPAGGIGGGTTKASAAGLSGYKASSMQGSDSGAARGGLPSGGIADYRISEGSVAVVAQPKNAARDSELERLRKMEANYERDKAEMARQKRPALARSESYDVGHAEGSGETKKPKQFLANLADRVVEKLARKAGS